MWGSSLFAQATPRAGYWPLLFLGRAIGTVKLAGRRDRLIGPVVRVSIYGAERGTRTYGKRIGVASTLGPNGSTGRVVVV